WTVINNAVGNPVVWSSVIGSGEAGNYATGNGDAASASSDLQGGGSGLYDTELWSPPLDLSGYSKVTLEYWANYGNFAGVDFLNLDISTNSGASWTNLLSWNEDHHPNGLRVAPGELVSVDLSPYAGLTNVILRWHYYDPVGPGSSQDWYAQIDEVGLDCTSPSISMSKTVGTDPGVCSNVHNITVPGGSNVTYCYQITNTGGITLSLHDLLDENLGTILSNFSFDLASGASVWLTQSVNITESQGFSATWTAYNPGPTDIAKDTDTAIVNVIDGCQQLGWEPIASVNTGRSRPGLAYSPNNGKFYLAGGEASGGNRDNPIEEYDPATDMWTDKASLLTGVSNSGAAGVGQYIYVPGGYDGSGAVDSMQRYDVQSNTVATMTAMPKGNFAHAVVAHGDKIYVMGGSISGTVGTTNYIYDIGANSWMTGTALPTPVSYPAGASDGVYIYVFGGVPFGEIATVQRYDPILNSWDNLPDMNTARAGAGAFSVGDELWVVGGGWSSYLNSTEYWDGSAWQTGPYLNTGARTVGAAYGGGLAIKAAGWAAGFVSEAEMMEISCPLHLPIIQKN
ncbi:MAG: hypothetical protein R3293_26850, partial [Candidatus Promineifilaceae bacterium]|nr:hypothetical protein [Candidatus Promineifilaceae bacterium]